MAWPASTSTSRIPYRPNPAGRADYALLPLKMSFADGGAYALLGPRAAARRPCSTSSRAWSCPRTGSVKFDGRDVTRASPQERNIAQVFQFPVIYDTMTVAENLAFPLRNRGVAPEAQIRQRVGQIAEMLEMSGQLDRAPPARGRPEAEDLARPRPGARTWRRCCSTSR